MSSVVTATVFAGGVEGRNGRSRLATNAVAALLAFGSAFAVGLSLDPASSSDLNQSSAARSLAPAAPAEPAATPVSEAAKQQASDAYERLPLAFAPNAGQTDERVRYLAQGAGFGFYFTDDKVVLSLTKAAAGEDGPKLLSAPASLAGPLDPAGEGGRSVALELRFPGANPDAKLEANGKRAGKVNYLAGSESDSQRSLPTFGEVSYRQLWPGIDMVFRGQGGKLKYEFHVAPGADPAQIRLAYAGAEGLSAASGGALAVDTGLGTLKDSRPVSYQPAQGAPEPVESRYALEGGAGYGFALGGYDRSRPLVIDPGLDYSTFVGGTGDDQGVGVAVDGDGSAYVTGPTNSGDFPTTPGAFDSSNDGGNDAFVTKLNPAGSALDYSTFLGGTSLDLGSGIAVDGEGSAYVTGETDSPDFPTTPGAFDTSHNGVTDTFVTKLNAAGSALDYSTFVGGTQSEDGWEIALGGDGSAYVTGTTNFEDFPTTPGAFDTTFNGIVDAFVLKLNPAGSALDYSTFLGGTGTDQGFGIAVDGNGSAYVDGLTESTDFPTTPGAFDASDNPGSDAFATKLNPAGSALDYSTFLGGTGFDNGLGIAVDGDGDGSAYLTGVTNSGDFPTTPGAFDTTHNGFNDAFVTKLNPAGSALVYSTFLGGTGFDNGFGIAVGGDGSAYVTGSTSSTDFPTTPGAFDTTHNGAFDAFVTKLNPAGSALDYSTYLGGTGFDPGLGIAVDGEGSAYVTGPTNSPNFPTTPGAFDTMYNGGIVGDAFVTKLAPDAPPPPPDKLVLEPKAAVNRVGSEHCVTATVTAESEPVAGVEVRFTVTGANNDSAMVETDANGEAEFCYRGENPGADVIRAFADTDGDGTQDPGEPGDTAEKTWVLPPPQHYKCYELASPHSGHGDHDGDDDRHRGSGSAPTVGVKDQFGSGTARVRDADELCNPAEKTHDGDVFPIEQEEAHLVSYGIKRTDRNIRSQRVELSDQFGRRKATVRNPDRLLVPSAKAFPSTDPLGQIPSRLDHYQCYPLGDGDDDDRRSGFKRRSVTLKDQFMTEQVQVVKPLSLCNPVEKRHDGNVFPVQQPDEHLTCYEIRAGKFTRRDVRVRNQFGEATQRVLKPSTLCVPSNKRELPPRRDKDNDDHDD